MLVNRAAADCGRLVVAKTSHSRFSSREAQNIALRRGYSKFRLQALTLTPPWRKRRESTIIVSPADEEPNGGNVAKGNPTELTNPMTVTSDETTQVRNTTDEDYDGPCSVSFDLEEFDDCYESYRRTHVEPNEGLENHRRRMWMRSIRDFWLHVASPLVILAILLVRAVIVGF